MVLTLGATLVVSVFRATNVGLPVGRRKAALFSPLLVPVASVLLLLAYNYSHFNHILGPIVESQSFRPQDWVPVFLGLHLDRAQGLFLQQPLWLLGVAGIPFLLKQAPLPLFFLALSYLSIVIPNSMHLNRYGGFSFVGRFELSAAMLWVFPLARFVQALVERAPVAAKSIAAGGVVYSLALLCAWVPNPGKLYNSASGTLFPTWMRDSLPFFADFTGWYENPVNWLAIGAVAAAAAIGWAWCRQSFGVANKIAIAFVAIAGWGLPGTQNPLYTQKLTAEIESRLIAAAKVPVASQCVPLGERGSGAVEFQIECITTGATDTVGGYAARPDGLTDAVIQVGVIRGSGRISSIQVELLRMNGIRQGHWDSSSSTTSWMVGVYRQNRAVASAKVSDLQLAVNAGDEIQLRITVGGGVPGQRFRVTLFMQDGGVATQAAGIP
jgi:hypothetical protein